MRILVLGATGALGSQVVPRLIERGHTVRAVVRSLARARGLQALGVEVTTGDILDAHSLLAPAEGCDAALHLATAVPPPGTGGDWSRNDRIRREGTANLLTACRAGGVQRYVQQSIIFLYGDGGAQWLDEAAPLLGAGQYRSAFEMEQQVAASGLDWCTLRGGAFYGPGTGKESHWRAQAQAGTLRIPAGGEAFLSLVHVVDMARAVVQAVEAAPAGSVFNVVDDEPVSYGRLFDYLAALHGAPRPEPGAPPRTSLRVSNQRIKAELGWVPAYPSYRSGLDACRSPES